MKMAASSAPRSVAEARPTRLRSTPSHATPNPTPVTAVPTKNSTGARSATAATETANPDTFAPSPHPLARPAGLATRSGADALPTAVPDTGAVGADRESERLHARHGC